MAEHRELLPDLPQGSRKERMVDRKGGKRLSNVKGGSCSVSEGSVSEEAAVAPARAAAVWPPDRRHSP